MTEAEKLANALDFTRAMGAEACRRGLTLNDNPFGEDQHALSLSWEEGWRTQDEAEQMAQAYHNLDQAYD